MYAIVFDFDTDLLKLHYPSPSWNNVYADVKRYLTLKGFTWMQGSPYFGDDTIDAVRCVRVVQKLAKKYQWFTPCVRDIRMLRIEETTICGLRWMTAMIERARVVLSTPRRQGDSYAGD